MSQIRLEADESYMDERLDKFLSAVLPDQSRSYLQKMIKDGSVLVNGKAQKAMTPGIFLICETISSICG